MAEFRLKKGQTLRKWYAELEQLRLAFPDETQFKKKEEALRNREVKELLFDDYLRQADNVKTGNKDISSFFQAPLKKRG